MICKIDCIIRVSRSFAKIVMQEIFRTVFACKINFAMKNKIILCISTIACKNPYTNFGHVDNCVIYSK